MSAKTKNVPLGDIRFDGGTQMRVGLDGDTVKEYRDAYESGVDMPPVVVYFDGSAYWLADGFHRWHAKHESGATSIECEVRKGSQRDAIWHAVGANSSHGLRRTNEDKHKAVRTVLADVEWAMLSDRQIADHCGVSHTFVARIREQVATVATSQDRQATRRTGADGKSYPAVPQHIKPTPKNGNLNPNDERIEAAPVAKKWACPNCGGSNRQYDEDGAFCGDCKDSDDGEPTVQPPKSEIVAKCEKFWKPLTPTERVFAAAWFNEQL